MGAPRCTCESERPQGGLRAAARSRGQRRPGQQDGCTPLYTRESERPQGGLRAAARSRGQRGPGDEDGTTAVHCETGAAQASVCALRSIEANVDQARHDVWTPLYLASQRPQGGLCAARSRPTSIRAKQGEVHACCYVGESVTATRRSARCCSIEGQCRPATHKVHPAYIASQNGHKEVCRCCSIRGQRRPTQWVRPAVHASRRSQGGSRCCSIEGPTSTRPRRMGGPR